MARHVQHKLVAYVHRQLPLYERNRVFLHLQHCEECRAALDLEQRLTGDLAATMALVGRPYRGQIARLWPVVWRDFSASLASGSSASSIRIGQKWLPSYGVIVLMVALGLFTVSGLFGGQAIAAALPLSPAYVQIT